MDKDKIITVDISQCYLRNKKIENNPENQKKRGVLSKGIRKYKRRWDTKPFNWGRKKW